MPTIEQLLTFNAGWILVWTLFNVTGIILLFSHPRNTVARAMRTHGAMVTLFLFLTFLTSSINVTLYPDARYALALTRALLSIPVLGSGAWLTYALWKVSKQ